MHHRARIGSAVLLVGLLAWAGTSSSQEPEQAKKAEERPKARFLGSKSCKKCHLQEYRSWEETKMAKAFGLLAPNAASERKKAAGLDPAKDYRSDEKCLACHVVGFGQEGGFKTGYDAVKDPERLLGVGCESCHGPGGAYVGDGKKDKTYKANREARLPALEKAGYVAKPGEKSCAECHKQESPTYQPFEWAKRQRDGVHAKPEKR